MRLVTSILSMIGCLVLASLHAQQTEYKFIVRDSSSSNLNYTFSSNDSSWPDETVHNNSTVLLSGSGSDVKSVIGQNFTQGMEYTLTVSFEFEATNPRPSGSLTLYDLENIYGTIHFYGTASDTFNNSITILNFDHFNEYIGPFGLGGSLYFSTSLNEITSLSYSLPLAPTADRFRPQEISFSSPDMVEANILNHDIWAFNETYLVDGSATGLESTPKVYFYNTYEHLNRLFSRTPDDNGQIEAAKICADAAINATKIAFVGSPEGIDVSEVQFRIKEDPDQTNAKIFGSFGTREEFISQDSVVVEYRHPRIVDSDDLYYEIYLEVFSSGDQTVLFEYPIHIYRAPITFVHGLWSDHNAFATMEFDFVATRGLWPGELTKRAQYGTTADREFSYNWPIVKNAIHGTLFDAISHDFSAGKSNVVCHSMGGVLTRFWIQNVDFNENICRLITLNTPHSGSQMANLILAYPEEIGEPLEAVGKNPFAGAIEDLAVDSDAIRQDLNGAINGRSVPSHVIVTNASTTQATYWGYLIGLLLEDTFISAETVVSEIFDGAPSDLIVADLSQGGGFLGGIYSSPTPDLWHIESPVSDIIHTNVFTLLSQDPNDIVFFAETPFNPPTLEYSFDPASNLKARIPQTVVDSVSIVAPANGTTVTPGSEISINVVGSGNISHLLLAAGNRALEVHAESAASSNTSFNYVVPIEAASPIRIVVVGYDEVGFVDIDTLTLNIAIEAQIDSLKVYPENAYMLAGEQVPLAVEGYFDDGTVRNLNYNEEVFYESLNKNAAVFIGDGIIEGISEDTTIALVSFQDDTVETSIFVLSSGALVSIPPGNDEKETSGLSSFTLFQNYPNPFNPVTSIRYRIEVGSEISLKVFDILGRKITSLDQGFKTPGTYDLKWDGTDDFERPVSSGVYFYVLEINEAIETKKMLLIR